MGVASSVEQLDSIAIKILDTDISLQKPVKYLGVRMEQTLNLITSVMYVALHFYLLDVLAPFALT